VAADPINRNKQCAVAHAIAQQTLEGLTVPADTVADLHRVARGEISSADAIRRIYSQFPDVSIFEP